MEDKISLLLQKEEASLKEKINLIFVLSLPSFIAQLSSIAMQYIDTAMVGSLGSEAMAAIGLVSSCTWLIGGILSCFASGFAVQIAHHIGAQKKEEARKIYKQALFSCGVFAVLLTIISLFLVDPLPVWLGADEAIISDARDYLGVNALFIVVTTLYWLCSQALLCAGDSKTPGYCGALMCLLDVIFNFFLIFETREVSIFNLSFTVFGAGLKVKGAALGSVLACLVVCIYMLYYSCKKYDNLKLNKNDSFLVDKEILNKAIKIAWPMTIEQVAISGASIIQTALIAPLGNLALAANTLAITAESVCYMPGFGVSRAATTLVGQAVGAKRKDYAKSFGYLTTFIGMAIMAISGALMYHFCPFVFNFLTSDIEARELSAEVLRIGLLGEAFFGVSIVASAALRGAGDTFIPGLINLLSVWLCRIGLSLFLIKSHGLHGAWIAMAIELNARGLVLLLRLRSDSWLKDI